MKFLSILIEEEVRKKTWKPVKIGKSSPSLTHSLFSDDIDIFGLGDLSTIQSTKYVLDTFCKLSRQTISHSKSRFCVSKNIEDSVSSYI